MKGVIFEGLSASRPWGHWRQVEVRGCQAERRFKSARAPVYSSNIACGCAPGRLRLASDAKTVQRMCNSRPAPEYPLIVKFKPSLDRPATRLYLRTHHPTHLAGIHHTWRRARASCQKRTSGWNTSLELLEPDASKALRRRLETVSKTSENRDQVRRSCDYYKDLETKRNWN